jgi:hypothetical protein
MRRRTRVSLLPAIAGSVNKFFPKAVALLSFGSFEGAQFDIWIGATAWYPTREDIQQIVYSKFRHPEPRRQAGATNMGCDDDGGKLEQRVAGLDGFGFRDIQCRSRNSPRLKGSDECRLIDYRSARGVDDDGVRFHGRQFTGADHVARGLG